MSAGNERTPTLVTCPHCRSGLEWIDGMGGQLVACPLCGQHFTMPPAYPVFAPQYHQVIQQAPPVVIVQSQPSQSQLPYIPDKKSSGLAVLLSFFYPGLGQIYNGEVFKGLMVMVILPLLLWFYFGFGTTLAALHDNPGAFLAVVLVVVVGFIALWVWSMVDAHARAEDINRRNRRRYGHSY